MSSESSSPVDAVLSADARETLDTQDGPRRERIKEAIEALMLAPLTGEDRGIALRSPYPTNALGCVSQDCWVVYRFLNSATIEIMAIVPWEEFLPDADR